LESSGRHLGDIWETSWLRNHGSGLIASGGIWRHLGGIWRHLAQEASGGIWRHLGAIFAVKTQQKSKSSFKMLTLRGVSEGEVHICCKTQGKMSDGKSADLRNRSLPLSYRQDPYQPSCLGNYPFATSVLHYSELRRIMFEG
jgi:hypothetical protein